MEGQKEEKEEEEKKSNFQKHRVKLVLKNQYYIMSSSSPLIFIYHFIISRWILDTPSFLISMGISLMTSFTCLSLFNTFIQWTGTLFGFVNFGLVMIMTYFFIPFLYLLGIPWIQIFQVTLFFLIIFLRINDLAPNVCN